MIIHPVLFAVCQLMALFAGGLIVYLSTEVRTTRRKREALDQAAIVSAGIEGRAQAGAQS